jgi:N-acetylmuramic acid 6-phosphate etherase
VPRERGAELLRAAEGSVKLALLMAASGLDAQAARAELASHGPSLRCTLDACGATLSA